MEYQKVKGMRKVTKELALLLMKEIQKAFKWWKGKGKKFSDSLLESQCLLMDAPEPPPEKEEKYIQAAFDFYRQKRKEFQNYETAEV